MATSNYTVTNGSGTLSHAGIQLESVAMRHAQELADEHGEPMYVSGPGIEQDLSDDTDLGRQVDPSSAK